MELADKHDDWFARFNSCREYESLLCENGEYEKALALLKRCEQKFASEETTLRGLDITFRDGRAENQVTMAKVLKDMHSYLQAAATYETSAKLFTKIRRYDMAFACYVEVARCYGNAGDHEKEHEASRKAEDLCRFAQKQMTAKERLTMGKGVPNIK